MKTMTIRKLKARFSKVLKKVKAGIGFMVSKPKRRLGSLEGKAKATFHSDFKITEEDLLK